MIHTLIYQYTYEPTCLTSAALPLYFPLPICTPSASSPYSMITVRLLDATIQNACSPLDQQQYDASHIMRIKPTLLYTSPLGFNNSAETQHSSLSVPIPSATTSRISSALSTRSSMYSTHNADVLSNASENRARGLSFSSPYPKSVTSGH